MGLNLEVQAPNSWKDLFKCTEDFLTAAVFSRLSYLTDDQFFRILEEACDLDCGSVGQLAEIHFWPSWSKENEEDVGKSRIEPDVYLKFENLNIIIEAKYGSEQVTRQVKNEITAFFDYHFEFDTSDKVIFIAVGGDSSSIPGQVEIPSIDREVKCFTCGWADLLEALYLEKDIPATLFDDLTEIFKWFGYQRRTWLKSLAAEDLKSVIEFEVSLESLSVPLLRKKRDCWLFDIVSYCVESPDICSNSIKDLAEFGN